MIKVALFGAVGRMGRTLGSAIVAAPEFELVGAIDPAAAGASLSELAPEVGASLEIGAGPEALEGVGADVALDFTVASAALSNLQWCAEHGLHAVCGTTGLGEEGLAKLAGWFDGATGPNCLVAPNFAISAVLAMRLAELAAPHFEGVEVIELHHNEKIDAPSGTAIETARRLAEARDRAGQGAFAADPTTRLVHEGARGAALPAGVRVHAVRLPGLVAHEEIIFGTTGQSLTIRQDSYDRSSFVPGVLAALRKVAELPGLTIGLEKVLGV